MTYMIKGPLFVTMRYTEMHPSLRINDYKTAILYRLCDTLDVHHILDSHQL